MEGKIRKANSKTLSDLHDKEEDDEEEDMQDDDVVQLPENIFGLDKDVEDAEEDAE